MSRTTTTTPGDYTDENQQPLYHPADPRADGGITHSNFLHRYRGAQSKTPGPFDRLTRGGIVDALSPDTDGHPRGGAVVKRALAGLVSDDLPEHLLARPPFVPEGMDPFEPLSESDAREFLGDALYRLRDSLPRTRFVTGEQVKAMVDARQRELDELAEAARVRAATKEAKAKRNATERAGSSAPFNPFTV